VLKATLTAGEAPLFTAPPTNIVLKAHQDLSVTANISGSEPIQIKWFRGNTLIQDGGTQIHIPDVTSELQGLYKILASNQFGSTQTAFNVRILGNPQLLISFAADLIRFDIQNGSQPYPSGSLNYLEIQFSTDLTTWRTFAHNLVSASPSFTMDNQLSNAFFRLVEYPQPPP
jgi:hypothetical protein